MDRRNFLKNLSYSGAGTMVLAGVPIKALSAERLQHLNALAKSTDSVLVFIQLHGGNDALNTLIPISQYYRYYDLRANLAIPQSGVNGYIELDPSLGDDYRVGLHPEMTAIKSMYDNGNVAVVQNVGYPDMNMSHFEGRDLVFMGADGTNEREFESGWMGRFLDHTYPNYPDDYPSSTYPDPLGIELSGTQSLAFHRDTGIPNGLAITNPGNFFDLINSVGLSDAPYIPNNHAGDEIRYIMQFEQKSNDYASRLKQVYDAGSNSSVVYPDAYPRFAPLEYVHNPLAPQLKLIARLLSGGIKTRVFLCRMGGFDTHGDQVVVDNPWLGLHASLMYHLSEGVKAFYDDMTNLGVANKVLSMTFTEFGRRARSNDSLGTDHGTSTPVFLFGKDLEGGVYGQNPSLDADDLVNDNLQYNIDYRQIYTSVVQDWFGASDETLTATGYGNWVGQKLPIFTGLQNESYRKNSSTLTLHPNPVRDNCNVQFFLNKQGAYSITIFNSAGKTVYSRQENGSYGLIKHAVNISRFESGNYFVQIKTNEQKLSAKLVKQ